MYIVYNFLALKAEMKWQLVTVSLTRSSAVAKRPRNAPCCWKYCSHSVTEGHSNLRRAFVELSDRSAMLVMVETIFEKPGRNRIRMALFVGTVE